MKNYKKKFPYKIGTTSYIIHPKKNNLIKNINYLKNSFHKIQLLLFGKDYLDDFLENSLIRQLSEIKNNSEINYSIHLPLDLDLLNPDKKAVNNSINIILKIIEKTECLKIKNFILHIDRKNKESSYNKKDFEYVLQKIAEKLGEKTKIINIENLDYDLTDYKDIIFKYNFPVCIDIGHLFIYKNDLKKITSCFNEKIKELHLHGFSDEKDHLSLNKINPEILKEIFLFLKTYRKSVIIEVFNKRNLFSSLKTLENYFNNKTTITNEEKNEIRSSNKENRKIKL